MSIMNGPIEEMELSCQNEILFTRWILYWPLSTLVHVYNNFSKKKNWNVYGLYLLTSWIVLWTSNFRINQILIHSYICTLLHTHTHTLARMHAHACIYKRSLYVSYCKQCQCSTMIHNLITMVVLSPKGTKKFFYLRIFLII